ncbi:MAG: hypothetical protein H6585_14485 [Flavobacteriales bacterium]|nr:hypothetical protein [Flavobacteriales bacterium]MCB9449537.1 hypothetical protein [Flavobacteriales bacterium]
MPSQIKTFAGIFALTFVVISVSLLTGCYREKPTKAEITVQDATGKPVNEATVRLYCTQTNCIIDDTQTTGSDGRSEHKFKAGTEYILFIEATKGALKNGPNDYIILEQRKVNTATVTIQ